MNEINRLDWNLVPALDALLTERNVSRAATRLGVTQSTMSATLARLRRFFDDDLLVRTGTEYVLSPRADNLAPVVREAVESAARVLDTGSAFDPTTATRTFTVAMSDYAQLTVAGHLHRAVAIEAPGVHLDLTSPFSSRYRDRGDVLASTDGWVAPHEMFVDEEHVGRCADRWVCVVDPEHDVDALHDAEWVVPTVEGTPLRVLSDGSGAAGFTPRVRMTTDSFVAVPHLVTGTRRVGLVQERLATSLAPSLRLRVVECPWPVQALQLTFWWDRRRTTSPAHTWLRGVVARVLAEVEGDAWEDRGAPSASSGGA